MPNRKLADGSVSYWKEQTEALIVAIKIMKKKRNLPK